MNQYCRYCAFCVNGDAYYCTLKEELLRPSYIKHANKCKGYIQSSLGDVDSLISRDELRENMLYAMCGTGYQSVALREIDLMPSVDAVPVIRCKDCKHWTFGENGVDGTADGICDALKILTDETFYCAESERKEE